LIMMAIGLFQLSLSHSFRCFKPAKTQQTCHS